MKSEILSTPRKIDPTQLTCCSYGMISFSLPPLSKTAEIQIKAILAKEKSKSSAKSKGAKRASSEIAA